MKSTGIVRRVDELGRVVLPIELRRSLQIEEKGELEIYVEGEQIILKKHESSCVFCGNPKSGKVFMNKNICSDCLERMKNTP